MRPILSLVLFSAQLVLGAGKVDVPAEKLHDQIRGGLLGHILGDLNGLKHENKYIDEPGDVSSYVPELREGAWTDDDTDVEWIYLIEMQRSNQILIPMARISGLWKRHINRRIWCSHLFLRQLLDIGIDPPLTGSVHLNPWAEFNLSAQFVSESWAHISPGMPRTAARTATHYTHVSVDGEPIQATQLFASMIATAFLTSDIDGVVDAGQAATDPNSAMHKIVLDVRKWHKQHPDDWRATRKLIQNTWSVGHPVADRNGVKLNGASTIAALLYGKGDFTETIRHALNFGWDADNNAATAGAIVGVVKGRNWIMRQGWNIKDVFRNTSRDNMPVDETITSFGDRLIALAEKVIVEYGGARLQERGKTVYRIQTETAGNIEKLPDAKKQFVSLQARLRPEVEKAIATGTAGKQQARAAYLAICLDLAPALKQKYPGRWANAVQTLSGYSRLMQALFYYSGTSDGDRLRRKASEAGLRKPVRREAL